MPPVTPRAIRAILLRRLDRLLGDLSFLHFLLRQADQLLAARDPGRAAAQQLAGARAGYDHEFKRVRYVRPMNHVLSFRQTIARSVRRRGAWTAAGPAPPGRSRAAAARTRRARRSRLRSRTRR